MFGLINVSYICITCNVNDIWLLTVPFLKSVSGLLAMLPTFALLTASQTFVLLTMSPLALLTINNVAIGITYHVITCIACRSSYALLTMWLLASPTGHHTHYLPCDYLHCLQVIICITYHVIALLTGHHLHYLPCHYLRCLQVIICITYHVITCIAYRLSLIHIWRCRRWP